MVAGCSISYSCPLAPAQQTFIPIFLRSGWTPHGLMDSRALLRRSTGRSICLAKGRSSVCFHAINLPPYTWCGSLKYKNLIVSRSHTERKERLCSLDVLCVFLVCRSYEHTETECWLTFVCFRREATFFVETESENLKTLLKKGEKSNVCICWDKHLHCLECKLPIKTPSHTHAYHTKSNLCLFLDRKNPPPPVRMECSGPAATRMQHHILARCRPVTASPEWPRVLVVVVHHLHYTANHRDKTIPDSSSSNNRTRTVI